MTANISTMMYVGEIPWHKLGTKLETEATAAEAIIAAGLNWETKFQTIQTNGTTIKNHKAVVRGDNGAFLGIVGKNYTSVQNAEAFSFFDNVVGQDQAIYHTAGALGEGERVWILAKLPTSVVINKNDEVDKFLLFSNCHNGKGAVRMFFTPIRVVCQNTLNVAMGNHKSGISIRHTANVGTKIHQAQKILGLSQTYYTDFEERAKLLAKANVDTVMIDKFIKECFAGNDMDSTRTKNMVDTVMANFEMENAIPGNKDTLWALFNGFTGFVDHQRSSRGSDLKKASNQLNSIWFGSSANLKQKAWNSALALV